MDDGRRIGLFGGSFDPVHTGHLILAERALDVARLERVVFMPTAVPPHKTGERKLTPWDHRREMVSLAVAGNDRFEISLLEGGEAPAYTWQSVVGYSNRGYGRDRLHLLVGSDSLAEIGSWRRPETIFERATIVAMRRDGVPDPPPPPKAAVIWMETGANSISSSVIRRLVSRGRSIRYLVPAAVEGFIMEKGLYLPDGEEA